MLCFLDQDPRDYFDSQQANALKTLGDTLAGSKQIKCSLSTQEAYGSLRGFISEIKSVGLSDPIVKPDIALKVTTPLLETLSLFDLLERNRHIKISVLENNDPI